MSQTKEGALKIAAAKSGVTVKEYLERRARGEKWCLRCKAWHSTTEFGKDRTRYDGMDASCRAGRNKFYEATYQPVPDHLRKPKGTPRHPSRNGDKIQARHHTNLNVRMGKIPKPGDLPCFDCGHTGSDRRHEYDHFLGYEAKYHDAVQAVCTTCHCNREMKRGTWGRQKSSGLET